MVRSLGESSLAAVRTLERIKPGYIELNTEKRRNKPLIRGHYTVVIMLIILITVPLPGVFVLLESEEAYMKFRLIDGGWGREFHEAAILSGDILIVSPFIKQKAVECLLKIKRPIRVIARFSLNHFYEK